MLIYVVLILIFLYAFMSMFKYKNEFFEIINTDKSVTKKENDIKRDKNIVFRASDPFQNTITYENTLVDNEVKELGINKCIAKCKGCCVEFGYTGSAYCFEGNCP